MQLTTRDIGIETARDAFYRELSVVMDMSHYTGLIHLGLGINPPGFWVFLTDWLTGSGMTVDPDWSPHTLIAMIDEPRLLLMGLILEDRIRGLGFDPGGDCDGLNPDQFLGVLPPQLPQSWDDIKGVLPAGTVAGLLPGGDDA